jgi:putative transposase
MSRSIRCGRALWRAPRIGGGRARAHLKRRDDKVTTLAPVLDRYPRFADLIAMGPAPELFERLRRAETIGRPIGDEAFIAELEHLTGRSLKPGKRGPKPANPQPT